MSSMLLFSGLIARDVTEPANICILSASVGCGFYVQNLSDVDANADLPRDIKITSYYRHCNST